MSLKNLTNTTNFVLDVPDAGITEAFTGNVQSALIPGVRIPVTDTPTGTRGLGRAKLPGSTFEFDPLVCRFIIDENLKTWVELYRWMLSINNYLTLENEGWEEGVLPKFITLHILDNTKSNIIMSIHYYGAWISDLGEIEYNYTEESDVSVTCMATFQYKYFEIVYNGIAVKHRGTIHEHAQKRIDNR
ncbi:gp3 tail completion and sheath stabilizer protein [Acinetobacter phage 133]|uniref:Gp3 tail completion and sheath stabilizer protein n=1 Tax=Acinetobacter phage 133 TaxID=2919552 RepID=D9I684_9CAUD|nr:gp3 tail completion and sheath stabilizer protein [Acinetobacter phage 133]ADJ19465.1 gp3 tail completion and sheath stabilizer protein [Acinetobacter phage 133]